MYTPHLSNPYFEAATKSVLDVTLNLGKFTNCFFKISDTMLTRSTTEQLRHFWHVGLSVVMILFSLSSNVDFN